MKIVVLASGSLPHIFLVNQIEARFGVARVIFERIDETGWVRSFARDLKRHGTSYSLNKSLFVLYRTIVLDRRRKRIEGEIFGESPCAVPPERTIKVPSVNSPETHREPEQIQPDILVVVGTSILSAETIGKAGVAINLHRGILPFYRGIDAVVAALRLGDQDRIGVTVHSVVPRVDAGDVLAQEVVLIEPDDNLERLEARVFRCGVNLMLDLLAAYRDNGRFPVLRRNFPASSDTLFFARTYSEHARAVLNLRLAAAGAARTS